LGEHKLGGGGRSRGEGHKCERTVVKVRLADCVNGGDEHGVGGTSVESNERVGGDGSIDKDAKIVSGGKGDLSLDPDGVASESRATIVSGSNPVGIERVGSDGVNSNSRAVGNGSKGGGVGSGGSTFTSSVHSGNSVEVLGELVEVGVGVGETLSIDVGEESIGRDEARVDVVSNDFETTVVGGSLPGKGNLEGALSLSDEGKITDGSGRKGILGNTGGESRFALGVLSLDPHVVGGGSGKAGCFNKQIRDGVGGKIGSEGIVLAQFDVHMVSSDGITTVVSGSQPFNIEGVGGGVAGDGNSHGVGSASESDGGSAVSREGVTNRVLSDHGEESFGGAVEGASHEGSHGSSSSSSEFTDFTRHGGDVDLVGGDGLATVVSRLFP